jgi:hypothetical protein
MVILQRIETLIKPLTSPATAIFNRGLLIGQGRRSGAMSHRNLGFISESVLRHRLRSNDKPSKGSSNRLVMGKTVTMPVSAGFAPTQLGFEPAQAQEVHCSV